MGGSESGETIALLQAKGTVYHAILGNNTPALEKHSLMYHTNRLAIYNSKGIHAKVT